MSKEGLPGEEAFYHTVDKPGMAEFKDRGSKFIAYVYPINTVEDFKKQLQLLKKEHPKAVHHCFAYRIGTDGNTFRVSDDGEPSGTAGRPILGQLDSRGVTNATVIVTRYFGGTLLGVPGLINAYKTAASLALQVTPIIKKQIEVNFKIQFDYTRMNEVLMVLKQYNCSILKQEIQLFCIISTGVPNNRQQEVLYKLKEVPGLEIAKL